MKRRTLLAGGTAAWAARAWGAAPPVVGDGSCRYRCVHDWGRLPSHIVYGLTHGVVVDRKGFVHVLHTVGKDSPSKDTVVVFDGKGNFVRSWGAEFEGSAHGFDLIEEDGREILYITDQKRGLYKTTLDGKILWHVERPGFYEGKDLRYSPSNVAVAPSGDVYLSDGYGSYFVHHFDRRGNYKKTFGGPGDAKGNLMHPHGLFVDRRGKEPVLVIAENDPKGQSPGRLQVLDLDGKHVRYLDVPVRSPRHFAEWKGMVMIPDLDARVTVLDDRNRVVANLGDGWTTKTEIRTLRTKTRDNFIPGKFVCPHDAAFDAHGNVYITEWVTVGRVTKLEKIA